MQRGAPESAGISRKKTYRYRRRKSREGRTVAQRLVWTVERRVRDDRRAGTEGHRATLTH